MYTIDAAAVIGTRSTPFGTQTSVNLSAAEHETLYLADDDHSLNNGGTTGDHSSQALLVDTVIGGTLYPKGTIIYSGGITTVRSAGGLNYDITYPMVRDATGKLVIAGDGTSVFVSPFNNTTPFDPALTYTVMGRLSPDRLRATHSEIPESYLNPPPVPGDPGDTCFARGTLIETQNGPRPVESLRQGDMILTRDNGYRWLEWVGGRHRSAADLVLAPKLRPVRIPAGALGDGLPRRDLTVSPQHRILLRADAAMAYAGRREVLVAAKHLVGWQGIEQFTPPDGVTYFHLLFDGHEMVLSDGCWTESLYTGPQALRALPREAVEEIRSLFPDLFADDAPPPPGARPFLTGRQGRHLARDLARDGKPLVETA